VKLTCHGFVVTHLKAATKQPAAAGQLPAESDSFLSTVIKQLHLKASVGGTTHALCFAGTLCCYVQCFSLWYLQFKPVLWLHICQNWGNKIYSMNTAH